MFARSARRKTERPPLTDAQLFEAAVSALATRSRSEAELRRLLTRKLDEPSRQRIDQVIARLHELGYLSDARLAENFVESRQKQSH
ncbi:MAG TPA: RecX family transcriptional regulator, partial [Pseudomonadota bacterium]|nr:RecX family transcriptional regulator [Pseudomonadota bacterium]